MTDLGPGAMIARLAHRIGLALSAGSVALGIGLYANYTPAATLDPPGAWSGLSDLRAEDWFGPCLPESDLETAWAREGAKAIRAPRTCLEQHERSYSAFETATGAPLDRSDRATVTYVRTRDECPTCQTFGVPPAPIPLPATLPLLAGAIGMIAWRIK